MMEAQLLAEINKALSPQFLDFEDYSIMFFIPRVLPKLGMALSTEDNYQALLLHAANLTSITPTVNLMILEKKKQADKENVIVPAEAKAETKSAKMVSFHFQVKVFPHISHWYNRRRNQQSSQESSSKLLTSRSFRTVECVLFSNLVLVSAPTAMFFLTLVFIIPSTTKGWSVGCQPWYFSFVLCYFYESTATDVIS